MPEGWVSTPIRQFLTPVRRKAIIDPDAEYKLVTLPVRGVGARLRTVVRGNQLGTAKYQVKTGDLMISKIDARKGSNSLLPKELDDAVVTGDFLSYEVDQTQASLEFLDTIVRSPVFAGICDTVSSGTTNRVRLDVKAFEALLIDLPPLAVQKRISDIMRRVDDVFRAATDEVQAARVFLSRLRESLYAGGADWDSHRLRDKLVRVSRPIEVDITQEYAEIGLRSHGRGAFLKEPVSGDSLGKKRVFSVEPGDLCFNIVFAWEGAVAVLGDEVAGRIASHRFPTFRGVDDWTVAWFDEFFRTERGLQMLVDYSPGGAGRNKTLALSRMLDEEVALPGDDRARLTVSTLSTARLQVSAAEQYASGIAELRLNLLELLLSGEHEIPADYDRVMGLERIAS